MDKTKIKIGIQDRPNLVKAATLAYKDLEFGETVEVLVIEAPAIIVPNQEPVRTLIMMTKVKQYTTQVINLKRVVGDANKDGKGTPEGG